MCEPLDQSWNGDCESMLISVAMLSREMRLTALSSVGILIGGWNWEPVSDGGGHLALVPMLTLLHGRLRLPICRTGFISGSGFGKKLRHCPIENIGKNPTTRSCS